MVNMVLVRFWYGSGMVLVWFWYGVLFCFSSAIGLVCFWYAFGIVLVWFGYSFVGITENMLLEVRMLWVES